MSEVNPNNSYGTPEGPESGGVEAPVPPDEGKPGAADKSGETPAKE